MGNTQTRGVKPRLSKVRYGLAPRVDIYKKIPDCGPQGGGLPRVPRVPAPRQRWEYLSKHKVSIPAANNNITTLFRRLANSACLAASLRRLVSDVKLAQQDTIVKMTKTLQVCCQLKRKERIKSNDYREAAGGVFSNLCLVLVLVRVYGQW